MGNPFQADLVSVFYNLEDLAASHRLQEQSKNPPTACKFRGCVLSFQDIHLWNLGGQGKARDKGFKRSSVSDRQVLFTFFSLKMKLKSGSHGGGKSEKMCAHPYTHTAHRFKWCRGPLLPAGHETGSWEISPVTAVWLLSACNKQVAWQTEDVVGHF